ncbi:hypothetical protein ACVBEQ_15235 [Nakamurella sp. GG22]
MRRTVSGWVAICGAAGLLLAGCSSEVQGTAQAGSSPVSTSATSDTSTSETSTSETSTSETSETSTSDSSDTDTSESTESSEDTSTSDDSGSSSLDSTSEEWFTVFCDGATDLVQYVSPNTAGQTLAEAQATVVETYSNISISASTTVGLLQATPPPTVAGGEDLQSIAIERFSAVSDVYGRGAQTVAALKPSDQSDLKAAIDAIEAEAKASTPDSMSSVDPDVIAAAKALPACKNVLN